MFHKFQKMYRKLIQFTRFQSHARVCMYCIRDKIERLKIFRLNKN